MNIRILKDAGAIGKAAASLIAAKVVGKPNCVLGLATGSSPLPAYSELVKLYEAGALDFSRVKTFNLDEYAGIDRAHEQSYYRFMLDNLFSKVNIKLENVRVPDPNGTSPEACAAYDAAIAAAGGIDLQVLGLGIKGHIAFNEPDSIFHEGTHVVDLDESTIEANKRFFASAADVPRRAVTMGIGHIMRAREIVLVANGEHKAQAVRDMVKGPIDPMCSASILQLHPAATILLDEAAASLL